MTNLAAKSQTSSDRIQVVDALRAFALLGIMVSHISYEFIAGGTPPGYTNEFTSLDRVVKPISDMLTFGKFFTVFSFLFGLSFAIQLANAARKGGNLTPRFLWRIAILFGIGFVHSLFFTGDILIIYAVLGFFLVPCQKLSNRVLLIAGTLLVLNAPLFLGRLLVLNAPPPSQVEMEQRKQQEQSLQNQATEQFEVKHSGSLSDVIRLNLTSGFVGKLIFQLISGRLFISFGLFLLGVVAGRAQLFSNAPRNVRFFRGTLLVSGVVALVSTPIAWLWNPNIIAIPTDLKTFVGLLAFDVHQASLSAFFVAAFTLAYWRRSDGLLRLLVPAGQMGLTTYLMQSVLGLSVFYGFGLGLMGKMGVTATVVLGLALYALQILLAVTWMQRYRSGPVEWLWRSLTHWKLQPIRREPDSALAATTP